MRRAVRTVALLGAVFALLLTLPGCDVGVAVYALTRSNKSSSSGPPSSPPVDRSYALFVANFASPAAAATEATNLNTNGGQPDRTTWTFVGTATATQIWTGLPANMNTALIQGPLTQVYNIDTFERLDANDAVVEVPTSTNVFANSAISGTTPIANASGPLDGVPVTTITTDPTHFPCVLAFFTQNIASLRVRIWGASQTSGDCVWSNHDELAGTDTFVVGGSAVNSSGVLYTSYVDTTAGQTWLLPFQSNGTKQAPISVLSLNASASSSVSVAIDSSDSVFVAASVTGGGIQLQKFASGATTPAWGTVFASGNNQISPQGLAVASNAPLHLGGTGSVIIFAGSQDTTGTHSIVRYDDVLTAGSFIGTFTVSDTSGKATGWSAAAISDTLDILTTGDFGKTTSGNIEVFTQSSTLPGAVVWPTPTITTFGGGAPANKGNAIGSDTQGFAYVAGYLGGTTNVRDSVLLRYNLSDGSGLTTLYLNTKFSGQNEFVGLAVDTDGTCYVVGYVTLSGTTSMWIGRFPPSGASPLWTATFNNGVGSDQAINVSISGNFIYVVGQEIVTGPKNGMRVFKFVK